VIAGSAMRLSGEGFASMHRPNPMALEPDAMALERRN
jgi:hypothetical protein